MAAADITTISDTLAVTNLKTVAENSAFQMAQKQADQVTHGKRMDGYAELAFQDAMAHQKMAQTQALARQHVMDTLNSAYTGAVLEKMVTLDPQEAVSTSKLLRAESDAGNASLIAGLAAGSISNKTAAITPPETGVANAMATYSALNQNTYSNNSTNTSIAALNTAIASILTKIANNTPTNG